jgi:uncharacterized membrane protein
MLHSMRKYENDVRLWALFSGSLFFPLVGYSFISEPPTSQHLGEAFQFVVFAAFICGVVGWLLHGVAVAFGLRLPQRRDTSLEADYDDQLLTKDDAPPDWPPSEHKERDEPFP